MLNITACAGHQRWPTMTKAEYLSGQLSKEFVYKIGGLYLHKQRRHRVGKQEPRNLTSNVTQRQYHRNTSELVLDRQDLNVSRFWSKTMIKRPPVGEIWWSHSHILLANLWKESETLQKLHTFHVQVSHSGNWLWGTKGKESWLHWLLCCFLFIFMHNEDLNNLLFCAQFHLWHASQG